MDALVPVDATTTVAWHAAASAADDALARHAAAVLGVDASSVRVGRLCPRCGSDAHGRPWVSGGVDVSLSRSHGLLVTAVSTGGPVGVDVESVDDVDAGWDRALVLHADERADTPDERARMWCRKEAILKAAGTGLDVPMPDILAACHDVTDLAAPEGFRAAVSVLRSEDG